MRQCNIAVANLNLRMSLTANLTNRFKNLGHAAAIARMIVAQSPAIRIEGQLADAGNQIAVRDELPALAFFAGYALDTAVIDSSRLIRTGQSAYISSEANYREALCDQLYGIFDCEQVRTSVRSIDDFASFSMTFPVDADTGEWAMSNSYTSAAPLKTMMIEAYYKWPTFFNIPGLNAGQTADGKRLLAATHVFRTEPF